MKTSRTAFLGLAAGAAFFALTTAADANGRGRSIKDDGPYDRPFSWTGFYVGGHAGGGWGDSDTVFTDFGTKNSHALDGGVGGVHAGYNFQFSSNLVAGLEVDFTGSGMSGSSTCPAATFTCTTDVNTLGSVRGRLGFAANRLLVYGTAGFAWGDVDFRAIPVGGGVTQSYDVSDRTGWVAGVGAEYALTNNWIIGLEWKHYDFGSEKGANITVPANSPVSNEITVDTITGRLSYKF